MLNLSKPFLNKTFYSCLIGKMIPMKTSLVINSEEQKDLMDLDVVLLFCFFNLNVFPK